MAIEATRNEAHNLLDKLTEVKLVEALNYLIFLDNLPKDQMDTLDELMENLGWAILGSQVAEQDWQ